MLKIRLSRCGRKNLPSYRIVVTENKSKRDSNNIENIGSYNTIKKLFNINFERYFYWISVGAQPTNVVSNQIKKIYKNSEKEESMKFINVLKISDAHRERIYKKYILNTIWKRKI